MDKNNKRRTNSLAMANEQATAGIIKANQPGEIIIMVCSKTKNIAKRRQTMNVICKHG